MGRLRDRHNHTYIHTYIHTYKDIIDRYEQSEYLVYHIGYPCDRLIGRFWIGTYTNSHIPTCIHTKT